MFFILILLSRLLTVLSGQNFDWGWQTPRKLSLESTLLIALVLWQMHSWCIIIIRKILEQTDHFQDLTVLKIKVLFFLWNLPIVPPSFPNFFLLLSLMLILAEAAFILFTLYLFCLGSKWWPSLILQSNQHQSFFYKYFECCCWVGVIIGNQNYLNMRHIAIIYIGR